MRKGKSTFPNCQLSAQFFVFTVTRLSKYIQEYTLLQQSVHVMMNFEGAAANSTISIVKCYYSFIICPTTAHSIPFSLEFSPL